MKTKMKVGVKVMPRDVVLDTQGRAVEKILQQNEHALESCRVGKYVELEIPAENDKEALEKAKSMTDFVLYNPLTEKYEMEVL